MLLFRGSICDRKIGMNRTTLFDLMVSRTFCSLHDATGILRHGYINRIAVEDGSGYNFIVTLACRYGNSYVKHEIFYRSKH